MLNCAMKCTASRLRVYCSGVILIAHYASVVTLSLCHTSWTTVQWTSSRVDFWLSMPLLMPLESGCAESTAYANNKWKVSALVYFVHCAVSILWLRTTEYGMIARVWGFPDLWKRVPEGEGVYTVLEAYLLCWWMALLQWVWPLQLQWRRTLCQTLLYYNHLCNA